jgi:hypothetical protein
VADDEMLDMLLTIEVLESGPPSLLEREGVSSGSREGTRGRAS